MLRHYGQNHGLQVSFWLRLLQMGLLGSVMIFLLVSCNGGSKDEVDQRVAQIDKMLDQDKCEDAAKASADLYDQYPQDPKVQSSHLASTLALAGVNDVMYARFLTSVKELAKKIFSDARSDLQAAETSDLPFNLEQWKEGRGVLAQAVVNQYWALSDVQQTELVKQLNTQAYSWLRDAIIEAAESNREEDFVLLAQDLRKSDAAVAENDLPQIKQQSWLGLFLNRLGQPKVQKFIEDNPVLAPWVVQIAQKSNNENSFANGQNLLSFISQVVEMLPRLTREQKDYLDQALKLYDQFGLNLKNAGYQFNTRFSFAHLVRLSTTAKDLGEKVKAQWESIELKSVKDKLWWANQEFAKYLDPIREDLLCAFQMFRYGPKDLRPIAHSIVGLTATFLGASSPQDLILNDHLEQRPFARQFVTDNARLFGQAAEKYTAQFLHLMVQDLSWLESEKYEIKTMQTLTKVFIRGFFKQQNQDVKALKDIFNEENRQALAAALGAMIILQDDHLLREFLNQQGQAVALVVQHLMQDNELTAQQIQTYGTQMQALLALTYVRAAEDLAHELNKPTVELTTILKSKAQEEQTALKSSLQELCHQIGQAKLQEELSKENPNFDFFNQNLTEVTANWQGISYSTLDLLQQLHHLMADLQGKIAQNGDKAAADASPVAAEVDSSALIMMVGARPKGL